MSADVPARPVSPESPEARALAMVPQGWVVFDASKTGGHKALAALLLHLSELESRAKSMEEMMERFDAAWKAAREQREGWHKELLSLLDRALLERRYLTWRERRALRSLCSTIQRTMEQPR